HLERTRELGPEWHIVPPQVRRIHRSGLRMDLTGAGDTQRTHAMTVVSELSDRFAEGLDHRRRAAAGGGVGLGSGEDATVVPNGTHADSGAAEVDADGGGYAFFSSSFLAAAVVSSFCASFTPFLNSLTLDPSDRASSGSRFAPKRISTMTR